MGSWLARALLSAGAVACAGCWDDPVHEYDFADTSGAADADVDSDGDADAAPGNGQGDLPAGWEGFGAACDDDEDCVGYGGPGAERRCISDVMGMVNAPGGFCTACCNAKAANGCAENIDCVGADLAYLICIAGCDASSDCRQDEGWECRPMWYLVDPLFPGNYCLPDPLHVAPDTDSPPDDPQCPWPWL